MAKRTMTKIIRSFDAVKDVTGKVTYTKREGALQPAQPRKAFVIDCGSKGKITVMVAPGQAINTKKLCKRL